MGRACVRACHERPALPSRIYWMCLRCSAIPCRNQAMQIREEYIRAIADQAALLTPAQLRCITAITGLVPIDCPIDLNASLVPSLIVKRS